MRWIKSLPIESRIRIYLSAATLIFSAAGLVANELPFRVRAAFIVVGIVLTILGQTGVAKVERSRDETERANDDLLRQLDRAKNAIDSVAAQKTLDAVADVLFTGGAAWRLSTYVIETNEEHVRVARLTMRRSGSEVFETFRRKSFPLSSSFLRDIDMVDLSSAASRHSNQTQAFPSRDADEEAWLRMHEGFLSRTEAQALRMPVRRYAWTATRDPETRQTIALMAESVDANGINQSVLSSPIIPAWLIIVVRASLMDERAAGPISAAAAKVRTDMGRT